LMLLPASRSMGMAFARAVVRQLPYIRTIRHQIAIGRYLQSFALLLGSGVPIAKSMQLATRACPAPEFRISLNTARKEVMDGRHLHESLEATGLFDMAHFH